MDFITFDTSAKDFVLESFDKKINKDGFVVEKSNPAQKVLANDGQELLVEDFAGIKKGSEVFIKSGIHSLIKLFDSLQ